MGPQSGSCGYVDAPQGLPTDWDEASMGPQSGSCGYDAGLVSHALVLMLQWVHSLVAVVMHPAYRRSLGRVRGFNGSTVW